MASDQANEEAHRRFRAQAEKSGPLGAFFPRNDPTEIPPVQSIVRLSESEGDRPALVIGHERDLKLRVQILQGGESGEPFQIVPMVVPSAVVRPVSGFAGPEGLWMVTLHCVSVEDFYRLTKDDLVTLFRTFDVIGSCLEALCTHATQALIELFLDEERLLQLREALGDDWTTFQADCFVPLLKGCCGTRRREVRRYAEIWIARGGAVNERAVEALAHGLKPSDASGRPESEEEWANGAELQLLLDEADAQTQQWQRDKWRREGRLDLFPSAILRTALLMACRWAERDLASEVQDVLEPSV